MAFDEIFRTNVLSHMHSVKAAVPELRKHRGSSIVLAESASSFYPGRGGVLYVSSKFAVRGWSPPWPTSSPPQIFASTESPPQAAR